MCDRSEHYGGVLQVSEVTSSGKRGAMKMPGRVVTEAPARTLGSPSGKLLLQPGPASACSLGSVEGSSRSAPTQQPSCSQIPTLQTLRHRVVDSRQGVGGNGDTEINPYYNRC